jgi:ABC-type uncharacterized transport system substrate-binding protein
MFHYLDRPNPYIILVYSKENSSVHIASCKPELTEDKKRFKSIVEGLSRKIKEKHLFEEVDRKRKKLIDC